jgi:uncharacterized membrane protein HdeD (DUF308 family)
VVHAFVRRRWGGFFLELFAGILYAVVGLMIVGNPAEGAVALTLLIAVFLMIGGASPTYCWARSSALSIRSTGLADGAAGAADGNCSAEPRFPDGSRFTSP